MARQLLPILPCDRAIAAAEFSGSGAVFPKSELFPHVTHPMKIVMFGALAIATAALTTLSHAPAAPASTPQFEATEWAGRSYIYRRGTGRRQILS